MSRHHHHHHHHHHGDSPYDDPFLRCCCCPWALADAYLLLVIPFSTALDSTMIGLTAIITVTGTSPEF
ncbi:hypothetical protein QQP08_014684, partial [Theobroma cacao]